MGTSKKGTGIACKELPEGYNLSKRIEEISEEITKGFLTPKTNSKWGGILKEQARASAMAIAISEGLFSEMSGSDPSEWIIEQKSREGDPRAKADPKIKELANYLRLSSSLLDKCYITMCQNRASFKES